MIILTSVSCAVGAFCPEFWSYSISRSSSFFPLYIMFWFVICDCNIRVVVGMGAQGLFILGFSLSVEVTFTFLSKSYLVHIILGNKISLSDCWNARRPSLLAMDLLQSPCRHFHPHSLCHWPGLRSLIATRLSLCLSIWHVCQLTEFVNRPRLSILTQALLTLLAWAVPQWRQLQLLMAAIALLLVLFFNFLHL